MLHEFLRRPVILFLASALLPAAAMAQSPTSTEAKTEPKSNQSMLAAGRDGAALGETLRSRAPRPTYDEDEGVIVIPGVDRIQLEQLTGASEADAAAERQRLQSLNGASAADLDAAGTQAIRALERDPSLAGDAHRLMRSQGEEGYSTIDQDPALQESREILSTLRTVGDAAADEGDIAKSALSSYSDCGVDVTVRPGSTASAGEVSYEVCEFLRERPAVTRERIVEVEQHTLAMDPYWNPLVVRDITVPVTLPVPEDALSFEFVHSWSGTVANVEVLQEPTRENAYQARFRVVYNADVCPGVPPDEPCAARTQNVSIRFTGSYTTLDEELVCSEEDCLLDSDGFATAEWRCLDESPRTIGGMLIDASFPGLEPLYPGSIGLCWRAEARYRHHYAAGQICWDSPTGRQCFDQQQPASGTNTCPRIAQLTAAGNVSCAPIRRRCAEGGAGHNEFCYVESVEHRCATRVRFENIRIETENRCSTTMSCMGAECAPRLQQEIERAGNVDTTSYGRQQAYGLLVHHILNDYTPKPNQTPPALIFDGRPRECRKALGGATDCCIAEVPGAQALWFELYTRAQRRQHALTASAMAPAMPGAAVSLADGFVSSDVLNKPFVSDRETIAGGPNVDLSGSPGGMSIPDILPEFLRLAKESLQLSGGAHCSANEFDLAALRSIGACSLVGTRCVGLGCLDKRDVYCCMNSPVSKNAREIMGADNFGRATAPACDGVTLEEVRSADWTGGNLDDLVARLSRVGLLPRPGELVQQTSQERITGGGSTLASLTPSRRAVGQRSADALDSFDDRDVVAALQREARSEVPGASAEVDHAGVLEWSPGFVAVRGERPGVLAVRRQGSLGRVSVSWATRALTAVEGVDFAPQSGTLSWEPGDTEAKPIRIAALRTARPGTADRPREFEVVLSSPTNGALLGGLRNAIVRIAPGGSASGPTVPDPSQWLRVTAAKRLIGPTVSPVAGNRLALEWEITVTNRGGYELRGVQVQDIVPGGTIITWPHTPLCLWQVGGDSVGVCHVDRIAPFGSITVRVITTAPSYALPGLPATNLCQIVGRFVDPDGNERGRINVTPDQCRASGVYAAAGTGGTASCGLANAFRAGIPFHLSGFGLDLFAASNEDSWYSPLPRPAGRVDVQEFTVQSGSARTVDLLLQRTLNEGLFGETGGPVTVRISRCPGDLRQPSGASEPAEQAACYFRGQLNPGWTGPFTSLALRLASDPVEGQCHLEPGRSYFLNMLPVAHSGVLPATPSALSCSASASSANCMVSWAWRARSP